MDVAPIVTVSFVNISRAQEMHGVEETADVLVASMKLEIQSRIVVSRGT